MAAPVEPMGDHVSCGMGTDFENGLPAVPTRYLYFRHLEMVILCRMHCSLWHYYVSSNENMLALFFQRLRVKCFGPATKVCSTDVFS